MGVATIPPSLIPALRKIAVSGLKTKFSIFFAHDIWQWKKQCHYFQINGAMFHYIKDLGNFDNQLSNNRVEVHILAHSSQCFTILIINYQTIGSKCIHWHRISNNSYHSFQTINQYLFFLQN